MINFYLYYNGELDNQHHAPLIDQILNYTFTEDLKLIEHIIKKLPYYAFLYAFYVIKGRWPEAEPYIKTRPFAAYSYARDVVKGQWLEAEPYIMKDPSSSHLYARYAIKGRWIDAESYIMKDGTWWGHYCVVFGI